MPDLAPITDESYSDIITVDTTEPTIPECTIDEVNFALAYVEFNGRGKEAYQVVYGKDVAFPNARAKELLSRAQVALKIRDLTEKIAENVSLSIEAHLGELADIRDMAKYSGQLKTALAAEKSRGEAVGIYQRHEKNGGSGGQVNQILIQLASKHDETI